MEHKSLPELSVSPDNRGARIAGGVQHLQRCFGTHRTVAVITGSAAADVRLVVQNFTADLPSATRIARSLGPTDTGQVFLRGILSQFGIDACDATADELQKLLTVVLRQGARPQARTVLVVTDVQDFGPRALEMIREIARGSQTLDLAPLLVLAGNHSLNRVLDSQGMAAIAELTRERWNLDTSTTSTPAEDYPRHGWEIPVAQPAFIVSHDQEVIGRYPLDRDRLLVGRSEFSDICLASRFVSRNHALLLRTSDGVWVIDLKSTNGTIVNSKFVNRRRIVPGDIISFGNYHLRYEDEPGEAISGPLAPDRGDDHTRTVVMRSLQGIHRRQPDAPVPASRTGKRPTAA
jgi:hypothetical protein